MTREKKEKSTAYHEAGHAVAAYRFNLNADRLTIVRKGDVLGSSASEEDEPSESSYIEQIIVLFAGFAAERKYNIDADKRGSESDDEKASDLLQCIDETESSLRIKARELIDKNWIIIEAMAEKLFLYKTLEPDEWMIIIEAFDEGEDWEKAFYGMRESLKEFNNRQKEW